MTIALWIVQGLTALLFLFACFTKAFRPLDKVAKQMTWVPAVPAPFVRFIGAAEIVGAVGLILPAATKVLPWLTIAAAIGLAVVMLSAAIFHASRKEYPNIGMNIILLLLVVFIVIGRWTLAPIA
jgi:putative oxidoreductase